MCETCKDAEKLFGKMKISVKVVQVEKHEVPEDYVDMMQNAYNYHLFPCIFIGETFIKGYDELKILQKSGE